MCITEVPPNRLEPEAMPANLGSVQPGGGVCYRIELAWGRWRRWYLKRFRPRYVARMAVLRDGSTDGAPHEILDPRDLKYCRNQCSCHWLPKDDPFAWRERLPFARWGLAELQLMGWPLLALTIALGWYAWYLAWIPAVPLCLVVWFFRDPPRRVPREPEVLVSPADGKVVSVDYLEHDEFVGGPAVRIGIFLSIFNVHLNRAPCAGRVIALRYHEGRFLSATRPESSLYNENIWIGLEQADPPHRRIVVRPIAGAIARRIVCPLRTGDELRRGEKIGMIKLGSRTELIVPDTEDLEIGVEVGQRVTAGVTVMLRYDSDMLRGRT
ncbi:MAG: phosphatidylserine decarboxylase family protein [Pirellulaceae bacterium]|nr:phosphatidylserine decarboxylase family protein [Pirellulaceae bacterium]